MELPADFYGHGTDRSISANMADVQSIEAIIAASYEAISGPPGQPRDWPRMRTLFLPESRSIRTGKLPNGSAGYKIMSTEEYIAQMDGWLVENGFFEKEINHLIEWYGNIAHVFSTYESRHHPDDPVPFMRGINTFQLFNDGHRWWIVNILWQHESAEYPIPEKYLP